MDSILGRARLLCFGISPEQVTFARRGFEPTPARARLEGVAGTFVQGYHAALAEPNPLGLGERLLRVELELRGFAFEGAAMALTLLDLLSPGGLARLRGFLDGPGRAHAYMVHVGAGWAYARLRRRLPGPRAGMDPLLGWLALDGYGFHEGFFHSQRSVVEQRQPRRLRGYALRAFDQGLGRSLWFVRGAEVGRIVETLAGFDARRRADLWSGIGLACAYAGGVEREALQVLRAAAGEHRPALAQGAAFAAKTRLRAENLTPHTELSCRILCAMPAEVAAKLTDQALAGPADAGLPAFESWRTRIQAQFSGAGA